MDFGKLVAQLNRNNFNVIVVDTSEQAVEAVRGIIPNGASVSSGSSVTLVETGILDLVMGADYNYRKGNLDADFYLTSSNAVTERGELYNVDGRANRVQAIAFNTGKLLVIVGQNKIVPDLEAAILRVKTIAAPRNAVRLKGDTYCAKYGKCCSLALPKPEMTDGCGVPDRFCCQYLVSGYQRYPDRVTVIIVKQNLGY